jgi:uncharacterized protein (TIGR00255 family)
VNAYVSVDRRTAEVDGGPRVDLEKARQYGEALEAVREALDLPGTVDLSMLARFGDVFRAPEPEAGPPVDVEVLRDMAEEAAQGLLSLREAEGARLEEDLRGRLQAMSTNLDTVEARAPERLVRERDRLREAVKELSDQLEVDEDRLAREIAYLAEKWDINEEIVRFRSHLELFGEALSGDASAAVGKKLGFLVQEMHREANTLGSKANDTVIGEAAMALKEEIERVREQVENVE